MCLEAPQMQLTKWSIFVSSRNCLHVLLSTRYQTNMTKAVAAMTKDNRTNTRSLPHLNQSKLSVQQRCDL